MRAIDKFKRTCAFQHRHKHGCSYLFTVLMARTVCAMRYGAMCQSMFTHFYFFPHWHFILPRRVMPQHTTSHQTVPHPPPNFNIIPSCNSFIHSFIHSVSQPCVQPSIRPPARSPLRVIFQWSFDAYKCFNIFKIIPLRMGSHSSNEFI